MDDPTKTAQDNLQQSAGQTSGGDKAGTSKDTTPETLTKEQYQKMLSDALAEKGRELKVAKLEAESYKTAQSKLESELTETRTKMDEIQRKIDEAEEESAKGSPESLKLYQRQKQLRDLEQKLKDEKRQVEKDKADHIVEINEAKEAKTEMSIISAAVEAHVDITKLKDKCQKYNLTTKEQIIDMAQTLAEQAGNVDGNGKKIPPKGDSGLTLGGAVDGLKSRYPTMYK